MSSFLGAKGASGFNLDLIKSPSSSSVSSSTLSKSFSVSSLSIINKRSRTPRKKPNQSYIEAATLLSTACPKVFSINNLHKKHSTSLSPFSSSSLSSSEIFPPYAVCNESDFLIEPPSHDPSPPYQFKFKPFRTNEKSCIRFQEGSPPKSVDYDVDSIFDDGVVEGIDSIMGNLSMNDCDSTANSNPFVGSSMTFGSGKNIRHALRGAYDEGWWSPMVMVQMKDIFPKFNALASLDKKNAKTKKKKKVEKEVKDESEVFKITSLTNITTSSCKLDGKLKSGLGLKLNPEEVIKAWGDCVFPISCDSGTLESSAEISSKDSNSCISLTLKVTEGSVTLATPKEMTCSRKFLDRHIFFNARLAKINLSPDNEAGWMREASILRYREKRRTRHFSKKICYQVRKVNADCRPRIKGRFVKRTRSPDEASEEDGD